MDDSQLRTAWQNRQAGDEMTALGGPLALLMRPLAKRVRQLGQLAAIWDEVIPAEYRRHTALESFVRGTLTVLVDSASHRFHLELLLRGGIHKLLAQHFPGALNRIKLVPGQFYSVDVEGNARYGF